MLGFGLASSTEFTVECESSINQYRLRKKTSDGEIKNVFLEYTLFNWKRQKGFPMFKDSEVREYDATSS